MSGPSNPAIETPPVRRGQAPRSRVFVASLEGGYAAPVQEGLAAAGFFEEVPARGLVFLKPNLTYPEYRPGVMTSLECVRAVSECLVQNGFRVIIGESDGGGYNRFSMDHVFDTVGIFRLAAELGVRVVNATFADPGEVVVRAGMRTHRVRIPKVLLEEVDAFISLPVPKIHMNTLVSFSIKNQWGLIQEPADRLRLHPFFAEVMFQVNRRLPRAYAVMDGRYGLDRSGPLAGDPVALGWVLVTNDLVAGDRVACRLIQVDEQSVAHLRHFQRRGWWTHFSDIDLNTDLTSFRRVPFHLVRKWTDWPGVLCFNSSLLAWLGYRSPVAALAHRMLYLLRQPLYDYQREREKLSNPNPGGLSPSSRATRVTYRILGVALQPFNPQAALAGLARTIAAGQRTHVCFATVHGVMEALRSPAVRRAYNRGLTVPDGMPLVWLGQLLGHPEVARVYGPDMTLWLCEEAARQGWRCYFYGGAVGVAQRLAEAMERRFPGLRVAGWDSPPFCPPTPEEDAEVVARMNAAKPELVFVGLGCPKQELWMAEHRERLQASVLLGVGAAFDFHTARVRQAPGWMQRIGLEWLFRLGQEPRRLWYRYLVLNPLFLMHVTLQLLGLRRYPVDEDLPGSGAA